MAEPRQHSSTREYLRVLRRHRVLVFLIVIVAVLAGGAYSILKTPVYTAQASLDFEDESEDLGLIGVVAAHEPQPDKLAAARVSTVTDPDVRRRAVRKLRELGSPATLESLGESVSGRVDPDSNLVVVEARAGDPAEARRIANTVAEQDARAQNHLAQERFASAAEALRERSKTSLAGEEITRGVYADRISRFESLSEIARPVSVAEYASEPSEPTSPRPFRDVPLAAFLGLVLGVIAAFARESLDRRLHSSSEIQDQLKLPVVGLVRETAMGHPAMTTNGDKPMEDQDRESFRILRANLAFLDVDNPPRSLLVTSALPEEGKSTVAASLAQASVTAGTNTLLLECDLRRPVLARRLGVSREPGLTDYLAGRAREVLQDVPFPARILGSGDGPQPTEGNARLTCVTAGSLSPQPAETLGSERFKRFLSERVEAHELVVIDSSPLLSVADTLQLVPLVDAVLVCVRVSRTTRDQMGAAKAALEHFPPRPTAIVVTGMRPAEEPDYGYYTYAYGVR